MTISYKKVSIQGSGYYLDGFLDKAKPADEAGVLGATWLVCGVQADIACAVLGLQSKAIFATEDVSRFELLVRGFKPQLPHQPLVSNAGRPGRVALHDFTLSAPKSVSVIWALSAPKMASKIQHAQQVAVQACLEVMSDRGAETRQGRGGRIKSRCPLVACLFEHSTSRDLDPQLHTHCTVFNLTVRPDGTSGAIEVKQMLRWIGVAATVYHSELARELLELGFEIDFSKSVFEVKGVPNAVIRFFSKRRVAAVASAKEEMAIRGRGSNSELPSRRQMQSAVIKTRNQKRAVQMSDLRSEWFNSAQILDKTFAIACRNAALASPPSVATIDTPLLVVDPRWLNDLVFPMPRYKRPRVICDFLEINFAKLKWGQLMNRCDSIIDAGTVTEAIKVDSPGFVNVATPSPSRRVRTAVQGSSFQL